MREKISIWLKGNWFKVGILVITLSIAHSFYCNCDTPPLMKLVRKNNQTILPNSSLKSSFNEDSFHSAMADMAELSCFPTSRYDCTLDGCTPNPPATYYFVDYNIKDGTYFRCDIKGCDQYPVQIVHSGSFTQFIPLLGQAMLFKVVDSSEFVDIATIGTSTILSFGKCSINK